MKEGLQVFQKYILFQFKTEYEQNTNGIRSFFTKNDLKISMEIAKNLTKGLVGIYIDEKNNLLFSETLACITCKVSYPEISPRFFSFNSPYGACPSCDGLGLRPSGTLRAELPDDLGTSAGRRYDEFLQCQTCDGKRLKPESLSVRIGGLNIADVCRLSVRDAKKNLTNSYPF